MRKIALLALLLTGLTGCTQMPKQAAHGSFVAGTSAAEQQKLADDVVKKLIALYPPAGTRFSLQHATPDPFGTALVAAMRIQGYALEEYKATRPDKAAAPGGALAMSYVFDQPPGTDLYRVTLMIGKQSLSRVYQAKGGAMAPAGYWVRKE